MAGELTSGTVTIPGLSGSGTDFNAMIEQLYEVEGRHAKQLIKWKNDWELRKDAFTEIRTELVKLQSSLKKLNSVGKFLSKTSTSSNSSVASATLTESSEARNYTLNVKQLAQAGMISYKTDIASSADPLGGDGTFTFSGKDGKSISITTTPETTLQGLVSLINGHSENETVTASIINTGKGQMLQLRSKETGENTDISVTTTGIDAFEDGDWGDLFFANVKKDANGDPVIGEDGHFVLENPTNFDFVVGKNAIFTLDGSNTDIESSSNIVKDAIPGITFNLFGVGHTTINVSLDKAAIKENVQSFVDSMNAVRTVLNNLTAVDTNKSLIDPEYSESQLENQLGSILTGNYGVQLIISKLKYITADSAAGFNDQTDTFTALAQIGIMTNANQGGDNYGLLEINTIKQADSPYGTLSFDEALEKDPEAVALLFASTLEGQAGGDTAIGYEGCIPSITKPGTYEVEYTVSLDTNGEKVVTGTIGGSPADFDPVTGQFTSVGGPSRGVVVSLYDLTVGDHNANVSLREGKINELLDALQGDGTAENSGILDKTHGSLSILEDNYTKIMGNINTKIVEENNRLLIWERRMRSKFARLEASLAQYNKINDGLQSQIDSLSGGGKK